MPVPPSSTPVPGGHCPVAGKCPGIQTMDAADHFLDGEVNLVSGGYGKVGHARAAGPCSPVHLPPCLIFSLMFPSTLTTMFDIFSQWVCICLCEHLTKKILNSISINCMHGKQIYYAWNYYLMIIFIWSTELKHSVYIHSPTLRTLEYIQDAQKWIYYYIFIHVHNVLSS